MWTHSDVAVLLKAMQTAYLLQQEEFAEPQPDIEAMLDRWDEAVQDFIAEPGGRTDDATQGLHTRARRVRLVDGGLE
jgi:2',3'-cyclic-nucleotide 2'-phosphodiesterase (5'-nucleotidase family)